MRGTAFTFCVALASCASPRNEPVDLISPDAAAPADAASVTIRDAFSPEAPQDRGDAVAVPPGDVGGGLMSDLAGDTSTDARPPASLSPDAAPPARCEPERFRCLGADNLCDEKSWNFENGADGWDLIGFGAAVSTSRSRSGTRSLALSLGNFGYTSTEYSFCRQIGSVDPRGLTLTAWVNLEVTSGTVTATTCSLGGRGGGRFGPSEPVTLTPDRWMQLRVDIDPVDLNGATEVGYIYLLCNHEESPSWSGHIYLDDVALQ